MTTPRDRVVALIQEMKAAGRKQDADALDEMLKGRDLAMMEMRRLMNAQKDQPHD